MQPITVHIIPAGPNPWKPVLILEELGLPYTLNVFTFGDVKQKPFIDINPNGRAPAIDDPNTGLRLWESGAILQYLISQYDTSHLLSYPSLIESHLCCQWLAFQISGQGPYFGQAAYFNVLHPTRIPSAMERYNKEMQRILGVLDGALEGKNWLVGDKCTFADLSFALWNDRIDALSGCKPEERFVGFPNVREWHERMTGREAWKRVVERRGRLMEEQGLGANGMPKGVESFQEYEDMIRAKNVGYKG